VGLEELQLLRLFALYTLNREHISTVLDLNLYIKVKAKSVPPHATEALGGEEV
jgi:hypothetical protein